MERHRPGPTHHFKDLGDDRSGDHIGREGAGGAALTVTATTTDAEDRLAMEPSTAAVGGPREGRRR